MDQQGIADLVPEDWTYLAEGNLHIVLRYQGQDERYVDKVLRLTKEGTEEHSSRSKLLDEMNEVQNKLLGRYRSLYHPLTLTEEARKSFITVIALQIESLRPQFRRIKKLDILVTIYLGTNLFHDFSKNMKPLASFSCEIKPKSDLPLQCKDAPPCSKFFLIQLQKIEKHYKKDLGSIPLADINHQLSHYDPEDLFKKKEFQAIRALLSTPQNNFRLFQQDKEVEQPFQLEVDVLQIIYKAILHDGIIDHIKSMFNRPLQGIDQAIDIWEHVKNNQDVPLDSDQHLEVLLDFLMMMTNSDISIIGSFLLFEEAKELPEFTTIPFEKRFLLYRFKIVDYELKPPEKLLDYKLQTTKLIPLWVQYQSKFVE